MQFCRVPAVPTGLWASALVLILGVTPAQGGRAQVAAALHQGALGFEGLNLWFEPKSGRGGASGQASCADLFGLSAGLTLTPRLLGGNLYLHPRLRYAAGDDSSYGQVGGGIGLAFLLGESVILTPHLDLDGVRIHLGGSDGRWIYSHFGYGGGLRFDYAPSERWVLGADLTVQHLAHSEGETPVPAADGGPFTLRLENGWQAHFTLQAAYALQPPLSLFARYRYGRFEYGASNRHALVIEPGQDVSTHGLTFGLEMAFD